MEAIKGNKLKKKPKKAVPKLPVQQGGNSTIKLPNGLHRYYITDHYTNAAFWFMAGLVYVSNMQKIDAALAYQQFLNLDDDHASVKSIVNKFQRQLPLFREAMIADRNLINLSDDEMSKKISNGIQQRVRRKNM